MCKRVPQLSLKDNNTWMDLQGIKSEGESQIPYDLTHKWKTKTMTNTQHWRLDWWLPQGKRGGGRAKGVIRFTCEGMHYNQFSGGEHDVHRI